MVQPLIREVLIHNGTLGERNDEKLVNAFKAKDELNLRVRTESGIELEPVGPIFLYDLTSEDPGIEIELDVCGLDGRVLEAVFGFKGET